MICSLMPFPKPQFFDDNGIVLAGGTLYFFVSGTTTPLAVYSDSSGTTPLGTSVALDSAGRAEAWLQQGLAYTITLKDQNGVQVWSVDGIVIPIPQSGGTGSSGLNGLIDVTVAAYGAVGDGETDNTDAFELANTAAVTLGAGLWIPNGNFLLGSSPSLTVPVVFSPGGIVNPIGFTLSINPVITDRAQHFASGSNLTISPNVTDIYPEWFGAFGDGSTDDYTAIQAAISSCITGQHIVFDSAKQYNVGSMLTLNPGSYLTGTAPNDPGHIVSGDSFVNQILPTLLFTGSGTDFISLVNGGAGGIRGVTIKNLIIDGGSVESSNVLQLHTCGSLIENCTIRNGGTGLIVFAGSTNYSGDNIVRNCQLYNNSAGNCNAIVTGNDDVQCVNTLVQSNIINNCVNGISLAVATGARIFDNIISLCSNHINIGNLSYGGTGWQISRNMLLDIGTGGAEGSGYGIYASYNDNLSSEISGNFIQSITNNNVTGIYAQTSTEPKAIISNNILVCTYSSNSSYGVNWNGTDYTAFTNNLLIGWLNNPGISAAAILQNQIGQTLSTTIGVLKGVTGSSPWQIYWTTDMTTLPSTGFNEGDLCINILGSAAPPANPFNQINIYGSDSAWHAITMQSTNFSISNTTQRTVIMGAPSSDNDVDTQVVVSQVTPLGGLAGNTAPIVAEGGNCAPTGSPSNLWGRRILIRNVLGSTNASAAFQDEIGLGSEGGRLWYQRYINDTGTGAKQLHAWGDSNMTGMVLDMSGITNPAGSLTIPGTLIAGSVSTSAWDSVKHGVIANVSSSDGSSPTSGTIAFYCSQSNPKIITMQIPVLQVTNPSSGATSTLRLVPATGYFPDFTQAGAPILIPIIVNGWNPLLSTPAQVNMQAILQITSNSQWDIAIAQTATSSGGGTPLLGYSYYPALGGFNESNGKLKTLGILNYAGTPAYGGQTVTFIAAAGFVPTGF